FEVEITSVNGEEDEDPTNDYLSSTFEIAPTWPAELIVKLKTGTKVQNGYIYNSGSSDISWEITDLEGDVVASSTSLLVNKEYEDEVVLTDPVFYKFTIKNSNCFGLHWWPYDQSPSYNAGFLKITKMDGTNLPMHNYKYPGTAHYD